MTRTRAAREYPAARPVHAAPRAPIEAAASHRVALRGLDHHVLTWGDPAAPKIFLLHGWMDVGASFQFLVDAFARDWYVIAPDLRGYGRSEWQPQGYWFADYVADLEALRRRVRARRGSEPRRPQSGRQCRDARTRVSGPRAFVVCVSLEGFGIPAESSDAAPSKLAAWLDALASPPEFSPYPTLAAVADRLQKTNPRLPRDKAVFLAGHWAEEIPGGGARLRSDPRHKLPFPTTYRLDEAIAVWRRIEAPTLWVAAAESAIPKWLVDPAEGEAGADGLDAVRRRMAHVRDATLIVVRGAGHMLHHDQPVATAAAIEDFVAAGPARD